MRRIFILLWLAGSGCDSASSDFGKAPYDSFHAKSAVASIAVSPDEKFLAAVSGDFIAMLDLADPKASFELKHIEPPDHLAFTSDGKYLVSSHLPHGNLDMDVVVWDAAGRSIHSKRTIPEGINHLTVSSDGKRAAVGCQDGSIQIFDLPSLSPLGRIRPYSYMFAGLAFLDGSHRLASCDKDILRVWDADTQKELQSQSDAGSSRIAVQPGAKRIAVARANKDVAILDSDTLKTISVLPLAGGDTMALSPDGKELAVGGSPPYPLLFYRVEDGKFLYGIPHLGIHTIGVSGVRSIAYLAGGARIATGDSDRWVQFYKRP